MDFKVGDIVKLKPNQTARDDMGLAPLIERIGLSGFSGIGRIEEIWDKPMPYEVTVAFDVVESDASIPAVMKFCHKGRCEHNKKVMRYGYLCEVELYQLETDYNVQDMFESLFN